MQLLTNEAAATSAAPHVNELSFQVFNPSILPRILSSNVRFSINPSIRFSLYKVHMTPLITHSPISFLLGIIDCVDAAPSTSDPLGRERARRWSAHAPAGGTRMMKRSKGIALSRSLLSLSLSSGKCCVSGAALNRTQGRGSGWSGLRRVSEISPTRSITKGRIVGCRQARIKVSGRTSRP